MKVSIDRGRYRYRAIGVLAALLVVLLVFRISPGGDENRMSERVETRHRGFRDQPSVDTYLVEFDYGGTRLHIPRNYLTHWHPRETTQSDPGFIGMATFPDFSGATRENRHCFGNRGLLRCDTVQFVNGRPVEPVVPGRTWYLRDRDLLVPREHGLLGRPNDDLFVFFGDGGWTVQVACSERPRQLSTCQMFFSAEGTEWRVLFRPELFPRWRELAEGLRTLIEGFSAAASSRRNNP
jgi:hypothetical protein